nr:maleylpyruvate isomerase family mycothiol-dependent enzyme [Streptomyces sp. SID13726]
MEFPDLLRLIEERSDAFRAAVASAADLGVRVPSCPDWTLFDLVQHLGGVHRSWAANVAAGPADGPALQRGTTWEGPLAAPREREALLTWSAESTQLLLNALREAGPDRGCWTWWGASESPQTSGAVARHQVQEATVHTYDAQLTVGTPSPLPTDAAFDGVDEFLTTCCATTSPWPHPPATIDFHATEGRSWRLSLSPTGAATSTPTPSTPTASARGAAGELVLTLYGRMSVDSLEVSGDRGVFDLLEAWEPED